MAESIALAVSRGNDLIEVKLGEGNAYVVAPSKGNDKLNFSFAENMNGG